MALLSTLALPLILPMVSGGGSTPHPPSPIPRERAVTALLLTFSFYGVWFLALYALIRLRYGRPFWRSLAWLRPPRGLWDSAGWGLLLALAAILLGVLLRPPEIKTPLDDLLQDRASLMLIGVFGVTLGPLCEELMFRGFLMPLLVRSFGALTGVLAAAIPFALLHGFQYAWNWQRLVIIFLAGAAFGWMRHRSGSTAAAALMHAAYNLTQFAITLVAQRQGLVR
ncbi:MAG: type II CAAX endopeptidase family protein [Bryobacteraceae bacterium]